jgi:hypothetical protein
MTKGEEDELRDGRGISLTLVASLFQAARWHDSPTAPIRNSPSDITDPVGEDLHNKKEKQGNPGFEPVPLRTTSLA